MIQFNIFTIHVTDDGSATEEMNRFLRSHKVLETELKSKMYRREENRTFRETLH